MAVELYIPGPVALSESVNAALSKPVISHRSDAFRKVYSNCREGMKKAFCTKQEMLLFSVPGTGAIDAGLAGTIQDSDRVLAFDNGDFGRRICENAKLYAKEGQFKAVKVENGRGLHIEKVKEEIDNFKPTYIAAVHNDTASTVLNPVKDIAKAADDAGAFLFVDTVSGLGSAPLEFDEWKIGACASSAQKCIAGPAGMSFLALSAAGTERANKLAKPRSYYFDLRNYIKYAAKNEHPNTPSLAGFYGLEQAVLELDAEGLAPRIARHERLAKLVSERLAKMDAPFFVEEGYRSKSVTGIRTDNSAALRQKLKEDGFLLSGGMGDYKDKVLRVAHMANMTPEGLSKMLDSLENAAGQIGF
ncbi:MAG: alanine--glyoxylate aminotransferase family protein [Candidatus Micrarchaeia archaeon]